VSVLSFFEKSEWVAEELEGDIAFGARWEAGGRGLKGALEAGNAGGQGVGEID
jgi:hypothetical protein